MKRPLLTVSCLILNAVLLPCNVGAQSFSCTSSFTQNKQCHNTPGNTAWLSANSASSCASQCNSASSSANTICCYYTPGGGAEGCKVYTSISSGGNGNGQWNGALVYTNKNGREAQICSRAAATCTCSNGSPATGSACTSSMAKCASCNHAYYKSSTSCLAWRSACSSSEYQSQTPTGLQNRVCTTKGCTCTGGIAATGSSCTSTEAKCSACGAGRYLSGTTCPTCQNQNNCAASTANTCSTTVGIATKKPCTSVTNAGYYLDGDKVETCDDQLHCAASTANTCSTTVGITTKTPCTLVTDAGYFLDGDVVETCDDGYYLHGTDSCSRCVDQQRCAASTANTCSTTVGITTKTPCTLVTDAGYALDGDKVVACVDQLHCAASTANTCSTTVGITTKTPCTLVTNAGYFLVGDKVETCDDQLHCAASTPNTCSTTAGITTKKHCTSVTDAGYALDGDKVVACVDNDANCDLCSDADTCTTCAAGYHVDSSNLVYVAPHGEKIFDGMCSSGPSHWSTTRRLVYHGSTGSDKNPGTGVQARIQACANACLNKRTIDSSPSWGSFVAQGFIVRGCTTEDCGRCYCESGDSSTCFPRETTAGYDRYDFTTACSSSHPDCAACVARTCDDANCDLCSAADTCMTCLLVTSWTPTTHALRGPAMTKPIVLQVRLIRAVRLLVLQQKHHAHW